MKTKGRPLTGSQKKIRKTICIEPQHLSKLKVFLAELSNNKLSELSNNKIIPGDYPKKQTPIKEQTEVEQWEEYCKELMEDDN